MTPSEIKKHSAKLLPIYHWFGLDDASGVRALVRIAAIDEKLHDWAEAACEGNYGEKWHRDRERDASALVAEVGGMLPLIAPGIFYNGDPRGWSLKLDEPKLKAFYALQDGIPYRERLARDWGGFGLLSPAAQEVEQWTS